ncbi:hypothetical protein [Paenibacillus sp. 1-18]|uniref:hypothetical protein n=1 Tax=Paenibacillus sp. 1-18 TaxID=1333846 RepID=UPI00046F7544|nr:hypothetical protein [Paenibacillus sp. 1-18]
MVSDGLLATNTLLCLPGVAGAEKQDARNGMQLDQADTKQEEQGLSDGTLVASNLNSIAHPTLADDEEMVITGSTANAVSFGFPYGKYSIENTGEPAYARVPLNQGESYQFINVGTRLDTIESDGTTKDKLDFVVYLANGTESSRGSGTSGQIGVDRYAVITQVTANPVTYGAPYRNFIARPVGGYAISRVESEAGKSYIFHNNGTLMNPIYNNSRKAGNLFDYVIYKSDGTVYSYGFNSQAGPMIPASGYAIVTVIGPSPIIFDYTDDFSWEPSSEPAFLRVTLSKGESYTYTNISNRLRNLHSTAKTVKGKFDAVLYKADGTEQSRRNDTSTAPQVGAGKKALITVTSDTPITFLSGGEQGTWIYRGSQEAPVLTNAKETGGTYQFIVADQTGKVIREHKEAKDNQQQVPANANIHLAVTAATPAVNFGAPYRVFAVKNKDDSKLDELIELIEKEADFTAGQQGKYWFTPKEDGIYRFAVKEKSNFAEQQPIVALFTDPDFSNQLVSSTEQAQIYGWDYTVLEYEMKEGQTVCVKLTETNSSALQTVIMAAHMALGKDTSYEYGKGNRLNKVILFTGDQIQLDYDLNGNVIKRTKKVFPFTD